MVFETCKLIRASSILGLAVCITGTGLVAFSHARRHDGEKRDAVVGVTSAINLSDKIKGTLLRPAVYARIAIQLDDPEGIFKTAHYTPVWTILHSGWFISPTRLLPRVSQCTRSAILWCVSSVRQRPSPTASSTGTR